jgi:Holliday junction resolvase RusA-like endonuclease
MDDVVFTNGPDIDAALTRLGGLMLRPADPGETRAFVHVGAPIAKGRPRFSAKHKRTFTPARTVHAERDLMYAFRVALNRRATLLDTVAIVALFYLPTRRRVDADNLMKLVMDSATAAAVWKDDSQVIAQAALMELDADRPRTVVALCPYHGTLTRAPLLTR